MRRAGGCPLLVALAGCATPWVETTEDGLRHLTLSTRSKASGRVPLVVDVDGETSMLLTLDPASSEAGFVESLEGPGGDVLFLASDYWDSEFTRTNAAFGATVVNFNWPILDEDPPLEPGRYRLEPRIGGEPTDVDVTLSLKTDPEPLVGSLEAVVVFAGGIGDDAELVRGTVAAVRRWRDDIYAPAGIELTVSYTDWDGPANLDSPNKGSADAYREISSQRPLRAISVVIVDSLLDGVNILGVAGGIPGALSPTGRSAVAVSALEASGADRFFSAAEEQLFGETIAHEVGHYLGLFHPVELPQGGPRPDTWDSLDDTDQCTTIEACGQTLRSNLMFPTPVCAVPEGPARCLSFFPQIELTAQQQGVAHRYVGVD